LRHVGIGVISAPRASPSIPERGDVGNIRKARRIRPARAARSALFTAVSCRISSRCLSSLMRAVSHRSFPS
jgi:hypothetical protein